MASEYVAAKVVAGRHLGEALKAFLEAHRIPCLLSQEAGGAFGFSVGGLGRVEVLVPAAQLELASRLIEKKPQP